MKRFTLKTNDMNTADERDREGKQKQKADCAGDQSDEHAQLSPVGKLLDD